MTQNINAFVYATTTLTLLCTIYSFQLYERGGGGSDSIYVAPSLAGEGGYIAQGHTKPSAVQAW